jgi:ribose/xylose/arabinose/galactoside ABC-type transport system permease subunit
MARISHDPLQARLVLLMVLWVVALVVMSLLSPYFLQARTIPYLLQYIPILGLLVLGRR